MISILIPYYNWDIRPLIEDLISSAEQVDVPIEIVTCDDQSTVEIPSFLSRVIDNVCIKSLRNDTNLGRSGTRNRLINEARYDIIIFIDGDSRLLNPRGYLSTYLSAIEHEALVIGGTAYDKEPPSDSSLRLHWRYGKTREAKSASRRNQDPERYFFTNNFCCRSILFEETRFDEHILGYGYEDSEWAHRLALNGVKIHHIENNVIHKGLKNRESFLRDADNAINTLAKWHKDGKITSIALLNYYGKAERDYLSKSIVYLARLVLPLTRRLLESDAITSLHVYDVYRLGKLKALLVAK